MKHILLAVISLLGMTCVAQTPQEMLSRALNALKQSGNVSAHYAVKGSQGKTSGNITMSGSRYRIVSDDVKCWFDGKTMWTYSKVTGEVNITTPTSADLQMSNPYAAAQDFKQNYNMWKAAGQLPGTYAIMMTPKKKSQISKLYLYIDLKTNMVRNLHVKLSDGGSYTITMSNYKAGVNVAAGTFTFDRSMVPAGTEVVDLR